MNRIRNVLAKAANSLQYRSGRAVKQLTRALRRAASNTPVQLEVYERDIETTDSGIAAYRRLFRDTASQAMLRGNIHRLEKGLAMKPRRNLFATEYID